MSALLALTAAMGGLMFECRADTASIEVFAPAEEVTAEYQGNVLTLYSVTGDGEVIAPQMRVRQVFDSLPESLYIKLTSPEFDVELEITDYVAEAATSAIGITGKPKTGEPQTITGNCTVTKREEAPAS
ncbi:hypothetical protein [Porphyrobacter sp. AAP60]|uniref:hypothetical protein n=1 Tax=Porphyrobacter sp. AAP60 TaxID=1523423 RepID=UPI0006B960C5|nr:hypothetical protein [Porphyrobacter sp. AAP60]KPF65265.1 hypothetical protein IP79_03630 [Porphyrobacter sp. AAP60]